MMRSMLILRGISKTALSDAIAQGSRALSTGSDLKSKLREKIPEQQVRHRIPEQALLADSLPFSSYLSSYFSKVCLISTALIAQAVHADCHSDI